MEFGAEAGGGAADAVASAGAEGGEGGGEEVGAYVVDDAVDAGAGGDFADALAEVLLGVVDDGVGAELSGLVGFFGGAGGGDYLGADDVFRHLDGGGADAGGGG